jgi:hypothetical protein
MDGPVATRLGIPDLLAAGPREIEELVQATGSHPSSLHRVLLVLARAGVLDEAGPRRFALTPEMLSTTLVRDAATRKKPALSTLGVSSFDISDTSESRSVTGLVGGSSWPSAGGLTA